MAISTRDYFNKRCPDCSGIAKKYKTEYHSLFGLIGYESKKEIWRCENCDGKGYIKPQKIIQRLDRFKPEVIY